MEAKSYRGLLAYQKSYGLVKVIYELTKSFPKDETYGLIAQMRRSAISIPSNIAEGYMRGPNEYMQFLKIALGSCAELETQLSLSKDLNFCKDNDFKKAYDLNIEAIRLIKSYLLKLRPNRYTLNNAIKEQQ